MTSFSNKFMSILDRICTKITEEILTTFILGWMTKKVLLIIVCLCILISLCINIFVKKGPIRIVKSITFITIFIIITITLLSLTSKPKFYLILYDVTGNMVTHEKVIIEKTKSILSEMNGEDVIGFMSTTIGEKSEPIRFRPSSPEEGKDKYIQYKHDFVESIISTVKTFYNNNNSNNNGTNIFDHLHIMGNYLSNVNYINYTKVVYIFSDMFEQTEVYDFSELSSTEFNLIIQKCKNYKFMEGIELHVKQFPPASCINQNRCEIVQEFWAKYFTEVGVTKLDYPPYSL